MLHCRSISHQNTPVAVREALSLNRDQQIQWLSNLTGIEAVILSTCNRIELYVHGICASGTDALWASLLPVSMETAAPYTVKLSDYEAAHHLFQVAASLQSMALGEAQILGQVTHAYEQALAYQSCGNILSLLFRAAIHAAKRVHHETAINQGHVSVSSMGISRVEQVIGSLADQPILVIGAGEMGQAVIKGLDRRHINANVTLVSRTYETARQVAQEWRIHAQPITMLKDMLLQANVVFTTSSAPFPILTREDLAPIMAARQGRALYIVDVAVPRDVAAGVADLPGIHLYDLDHLQHVVEENWLDRQNALPQAHAIIEAELLKFWHEYQGRAVVPTIQQLREQVDHIRAMELERVFKRLPEDEDVRALFEEFSHRFMNKVLHQPTHNLKLKAQQGSGALFDAVTRDLFGLEENAS